MSVLLPTDEAERLEALKAYKILDTPPEPAFDDLTFLASQICDTPIALISLVDEKRQWFKSRLGTNTAETPRDVAFCAHALLRPDQVFEVNDALADSRFSSSALVTSDPHARFYAGAPLVTAEGHLLGALCVIDRKPRDLTADQLAALRALSRQVVAQLEIRRHGQQLIEEGLGRRLVEDQLRQQNEKLSASLEAEQRTSKDLARTNRSLKMLSSCNEAMIVAREEGHLLNQVCNIAVEIGGRRMAWVGYAQEDDGKSIVPMAQSGDDSGYLTEVRLTWDVDQPAGRGPAGQCIRESKATLCPDIRDPSNSFDSVAAAEKRGYRSVICLPLRDTQRAFGLLALYSNEVGEVGESELKPLRELADDLAFGISALRSRAVQIQAEEALVSSLREKEALLKEVHHRVKNNLQVIASLLRLEGRRIDHDITKSVLKEMQGRIQSMALLHETLYRSGNFSKVDLAAYLTQLANQLFRSLLSQPGAVRLNLDLAQVHLDIDQAIPCGLIVNELASNSLKHGFQDGRSGDVWIRLGVTEGEAAMVTLSVSDSGVGLPPGFDVNEQRSLGLQLVSDLARQLHGQFKILPGPPAVFQVAFLRNRGVATGEISRALSPTSETTETRRPS